MFTGLIQAVGRLEQAQARGSDLRLRIGTGAMPVADLQLGESIAVSGVCLTVVEFAAASFCVDVSNETLSLTTLGALTIGATLNLERAMLPTTRLGGHLVAGHVDGVGHLQSIVADGRSQRWRFSIPPELSRYLAVKGSVCVDGVSLTVNASDASGFEVNLVPHTLDNTALAQSAVGTPVNLEVDLIARYLERLAQCAR